MLSTVYHVFIIFSWCSTWLVVIGGTLIIVFGRQSKPSSSTTLPVSLLKPLKGTDNKLKENLESCFTQKHPCFEIILSVADEKDPAIQIVHELLVKYPQVDAQLVISKENVGVNPKINNLIRGYRVAKYPIIWIMDSNVFVEPGTMKRSCDLLKDPRVGLVHHLPCGMKPQSFGSALEALYLNTTHSKMYKFVNFTGAASCVNGKSNMYRKKDLETLGGLDYFGKYLAEDNVIGQHMLKLGYKHAMTVDLAQQALGKLTVYDFIHRRIRWIRVRKYTVPRATLYEPLTECFLCGYLMSQTMRCIFGVSSSTFFVFHVLAWFFCDSLVYSKLDSSLIKRPLYYTSAWLFKETLTLPIWILAMGGTTVEWRGKHYELNLDGTVKNSDGQQRKTTWIDILIDLMVFLLGMDIFWNDKHLDTPLASNTHSQSSLQSPNTSTEAEE